MTRLLPDPIKIDHAFYQGADLATFVGQGEQGASAGVWICRPAHGAGGRQGRNCRVDRITVRAQFWTVSGPTAVPDGKKNVNDQWNAEEINHGL